MGKRINITIGLIIVIGTAFSQPTNIADKKNSSKESMQSLSTCGRTNTSHLRIVGGIPADLGAWPWMAALGYQKSDRPTSNVQWLCGGALISDRYVLTVATCTSNTGARKLVVVRLGDLNLNDTVNDEAEPIDVKIANVITHEKYDAIKNSYNIALLKLEKSIRFSDNIQPICLPTSNQHNKLLVGSKPYVAGWGTTSYGGLTSDTLMEVQVPIMDNEVCKRLMLKFTKYEIDDQVMCTGYLAGGKDACQGDSGSPLMWPNNNQYYVVGLVSFGYKCAEPNSPSVYTRVSTFIPWIADAMIGD